MRLGKGTVLLVALDPTRGHEQRGMRPCVVVSDSQVAAEQRFPLVAVVPVTRTPGAGLLYPELQPGPSGLISTSYALVDHLRSVDKRRVLRVYGELSPDEVHAIDEGLAAFLGLPAPPPPTASSETAS